MTGKRRWNGWGSVETQYPLPVQAGVFLKQLLGEGKALPGITLEQVISKVPETRLEPNDLYSTGPFDRICHARGQSLPDWLAMKCGDYGQFPDAVAFPQTRQDVINLLELAKQNQYVIIPYGGGTSVAGHINPQQGDRPVITVDMGRMNRMLGIDKESQLATFGAGVVGPELESQLRGQGYTLGHYPQSFELSTLGGWVASRSSGQQSLHYGRIEQLFAGGKLETFNGCLELASIPASSAGMDLREVVMGSEGRIGILSEIDVNISPLPKKEGFFVAFLPDWESGVTVMREAAQQRLPLSMLRLSNPIETYTQLRLAGHEKSIAWLERYLSLRCVDEGKTMLTFGVTGSRSQYRHTKQAFRKLLKVAGAVYIGSVLGKRWQHGRFRFPYLRESLWQQGYMVDTLETCTPWSNVTPLMNAIEKSLAQALSEYSENTHVFTHLSHVYSQGSSIYTTYLFRAGGNAADTLQRWKKLKETTSRIIVEHGGTISHQHGVGKDHAPYLNQEKGEYGMHRMKQICELFDPNKQLNPGTLLDD